MPFILHYILKLSVSLCVIYLFYRFILRPITFYSWNRWYLLGYSLFAFVIPFIDINPMLSAVAPAQSQVINFIPVIDAGVIESKSWLNLSDGGTWIILAIISGMLVMAFRLVIQLLSYRGLRKNAILLSDNPVKIFQVNKNIVPFSFGNAIFINREQHAEHEMQEIIRHEFVHIRQKHSADMIFAEILCILNWYNPFAWLIRKVICQNLEFIADQQVLRFGLDKKQYQYLLLKVAGGASFRITNQFNFSFLRKRIAMMNKMHSARVHLVRFLFILPLLAVLLLSFRQKIEVFLEVPDTTDEMATKRLLPTNDQFTLLLHDTIPARKITDTLQAAARAANLWQDSSQIFDPKSHRKPLFIVDEIVQDYAFVEGMDPASIARLEVLKDKHALQYGEQGRNGVVRIYTKPVTPRLQLKEQVIHVTVSDNNQVRLRNTADSVTVQADSIIIHNYPPGITVHDSVFVNAVLDNKTNPSTLRLRSPVRKPDVLIIVDGHRYLKGADINKINPDEIESISVLKDAAAISKYGPDAENGVILVTTKKNISIDPPSSSGNKKGGEIREIRIKPLDSTSRKPYQSRFD